MNKKRYITSHSNFILKRKHQDINDGSLLERDYMTIGTLNGYSPGQIPIFNESNFKMTIRNSSNSQIKHRYGSWDKRTTECNDFNDSTIWTLNCLSNDSISNDTKIVIKPNYTSLLDFSYFGSSVELIRSSINNIINYFPGELYLSSNHFYFYKNDKVKKPEILGGNDKFIVDNPFEIDLITKSISNVNVSNDVRYFCKSYNLYMLYDNNNNAISNISWNVSNTNKACYNNGDLIATINLGVCNLYYYYYNGSKILLHDGKYKTYHIRPNESTINKFFQSLDDFESLLLNRETNPIYKITLDTIEETESSPVIYKKNYIWPITNGWNLDITSPSYNSYLNDLIKMAEYYDEYYTNNIWRSLTHESIKNLDSTYTKENSNITSEDYNDGISRIEGMLMAYGRQFDDIKRYIDNIKTANIITYDNKNNTPDYFLSDSLELAGWDVINVMPSQDKNILVKNLFTGENKTYNSIDANNEFLKRLKLNSKYIFSTKGTKNSIEMMFALFGLKKFSADTNSGDYMIYEYDGVSIPNSNYTPEEFVKKIKEINQLKNNFFYESSESDIQTDYLQGLPIKLVTINNENDDEIFEYIIPWFDKLQTIDGTPYFQMKGGWDKTITKDINLEIAPNITKIKETKNVKLYGETNKYLKFVNKLSDLINIPLQNLKNNDIYYVYDITDLKYNYKPDINNNIDNYSHYFILKEREYSNIIGEINDSGILHVGWYCIKNDDIQMAKTDDAIRVLSLESIIDCNNGNNPHTGNGDYDNGEDYINYFRSLFKYSIENDNFTDLAYDCNTGDLLDEINNIGFNVKYVNDNMKCWYFTDTQNKYIQEQNKYKLPLELKINQCETNNENYCGYKQIINNDNDIIYVGKEFNGSLYSSDLTPYNPENIINNDKSYDIAAANSIINVKLLKIEFIGNIIKECDRDEKGKCLDGRDFKSYLRNVILPYVKQVISSTTILEIIIGDENAYYTCFKMPNICAVTNKQ